MGVIKPKPEPLSQSPRPRLLFISPVWPCLTGNGLAMRAAHTSRSLSHRFDVHMLVLSDAPPVGPMPDWLSSLEALPAVTDSHFQLIQRIADPSGRLKALCTYPRPLDCRQISRAAIDRVTARAKDMDGIHVMRLYLAPLIEGLKLDQPQWRSLDCDDDDSAYHRMYAERLDAEGASDLAQFERSEAAKYDALKTSWLARFNKVFTASDQDHYGMIGAPSVATMPNIADDVPPRVSPSASPELRMLFVGNLAYAPNLDALKWLDAFLLPALDQVWDQPIRLDVIGGGLPPQPQGNGRIRLHGQVADLTPYYDDCDLAVVPLRFGSGMPLKLLEAFARRIPVVTTTYAANAAGITTKECYIADEAHNFAAACIRAKTDAAHTALLTDSAAETVERRYSAPSLEAIITTEFSL